MITGSKRSIVVQLNWNILINNLPHEIFILEPNVQIVVELDYLPSDKNVLCIWAQGPGTNPTKGL